MTLALQLLGTYYRPTNLADMAQALVRAPAYKLHSSIDNLPLLCSHLKTVLDVDETDQARLVTSAHRAPRAHAAPARVGAGGPDCANARVQDGRHGAQSPATR